MLTDTFNFMGALLTFNLGAVTFTYMKEINLQSITWNRKQSKLSNQYHFLLVKL